MFLFFNSTQWTYKYSKIKLNTTLCKQISFSRLGLSFVSALYSLGIALAVLILVFQQILLMSLGMSRNEWNALPLSKKLLCGTTVHRPNNKGFFCNWLRLCQRPQHTAFADQQWIAFSFIVNIRSNVKYINLFLTEFC